MVLPVRVLRHFIAVTSVVDIPMNDEEIFHLALEKLPSERAAFLDQACGGDAARRDRVEALLEAHLHPVMFMKPGVSREELPPILLSPPGTIIGRYKLLEPIGEGGY